MGTPGPGQVTACGPWDAPPSPVQPWHLRVQALPAPLAPTRLTLPVSPFFPGSSHRQNMSSGVPGIVPFPPPDVVFEAFCFRPSCGSAPKSPVCARGSRGPALPPASVPAALTARAAPTGLRPAAPAPPLWLSVGALFKTSSWAQVPFRLPVLGAWGALSLGRKPSTYLARATTAVSSAGARAMCSFLLLRAVRRRCRSDTTLFTGGACCLPLCPPLLPFPTAISSRRSLSSLSSAFGSLTRESWVTFVTVLYTVMYPGQMSHSWPSLTRGLAVRLSLEISCTLGTAATLSGPVWPEARPGPVPRQCPDGV